MEIGLWLPKRSVSEMTYLVRGVLLSSVILGYVCCWKEIEYDKDGDLSLDELVKKYGNVAISRYELTLPDGYIIEVHRFKRDGAEKLKPMLFLHGLSACSDTFFIDKRGSIPFIFANLGYDIWFINNRGTIHSRRHLTLNSTTDAEYWRFSWQEMGLVDLPATIDLVLRNNDNDKLALIGHSEGSFLIFVTLSELPEYNDKVAISFHWGGAAYHSGCNNKIVKIACINRNFIQEFLDTMGIVQLIPTVEARQTIISMCRMDFLNSPCRDILFDSLFVTAETFDSFEDVSFIFSKWLCGGSTREFTHFSQIGTSGRFARYDYGKEKNKEIYNSTIPPRFHLERITSPTAIFCGSRDIYCVKENIDRAMAEIPNVVYSTPIEGLGHVDFILNKLFRKYIYKDMLKLLQKYL